jgi:outer membrane protein
MRKQKRRAARTALAAIGLVSAGLSLAGALGAARAETIGGALTKAYLNNPDINAQRAVVRQADEGVPKANSGYLPTAAANANAGVQSEFGQDFGKVEGSSFQQTSLPRGYGVTVTQQLWNGNKTFNTVREAESTVFGQREQLRNTEQNTLLNGLTDYMNVMHDTAAVDLNKSNVEVLKEQLRQTNDRFNVGEVTRTDVAQAQAALAAAEATYLQAQATVQASIASYRQVIGDQPKSLAPVKPVAKLLPSGLSQAVAISQVEHPAITAALHGIDVALLTVKINEAALYPTVGLQGSLQKSFDLGSGVPNGSKALIGSLVGQISIPIYDGGASYASIREAKENVSQQELTADSQREKVRQAVVTAWSANEISTGVVKAAKANVTANEVALAGVREEAKVGQRTTLDVLNAQQLLLQARLQLVTAERDQVIDSYTLLSAIGRLSVRVLGLSVAEYDPRVHFEQVKTKQFGVRTPDGR